MESQAGRLGLTRASLEAAEEARLAPWAMRSAAARRRLPIDPEGRAFDFRTEFQRDRDRIVHARAFRRLRQKTQVYLPDRSDHFRNRLIHTLEVAGLARTLARALALNEDLTEAIALGHDLGQSPFGACGEAVLHGILTGKVPIPGLRPEVAAGCGGFRHSDQGLRVVDRLEKRYRHDGLNLTDPVREGILRQAPPAADIRYPDVLEEGLNLDKPPFLEVQVVALADRLAQQVHDLDDGLQEGEVEPGEVERLGVAREVAARVGGRLAAARWVRLGQLNRGIVHLFVVSAATHTAAAIEEWAGREGVGAPEEFEARRSSLPTGLVGLPPAAQAMYDELAAFVARRVINSAVVSRMDERARRVLTALFAACYRNPGLLEDHVLLRFKEAAGVRFLRDCDPAELPAEFAARYWNNPVFVRNLADHLAAGTDTWALSEYKRLLGPDR